MAILSLPKRLDRGFRIYFGLEDSVRGAIIDSIRANSSVNLRPKQLAGKLADTGLDPQDLDSVVRMIYSVVAGPIDTGQKAKQFISDIVDTLRSRGDDTIVPNQSFVEEMMIVFEVMEPHVKARSLAFDREKILRNSKILSDVRPIFDSNDPSKIHGFTILHTLQVEFTETGKWEMHQFAMSTDDLEELKQHIERAEEKEAALRKVMSPLGLEFVDITNND